MSGAWFAMLWEEESGSTGVEPYHHLTCAALGIKDPVDLPYSTAFRHCYSCWSLSQHLWLCWWPTTDPIAIEVMVLDLLFAFTITINSIANWWLFGEHMWHAGVYFNSSEDIIDCSYYIIDRYLSVFCPCFYPKYKAKINLMHSSPY